MSRARFIKDAAETTLPREEPAVRQFLTRRRPTCCAGKVELVRVDDGWLVDDYRPVSQEAQ